MSTPSLAVLEVESRPATPPVVVQRYRPGSFGRIVEMHASYYSGAFGFGLRFEAVVASGLAEFAGRLERPRNAMWCALEGDRIVGSVAIDGEDLGGDVAHLRGVIVESAQRGAGVVRGRAWLRANGPVDVSGSRRGSQIVRARRVRLRRGKSRPPMGR
jgi:hypothetical protein